MKTALTIAGSDCSGGAGIQADIKVFTAFNVYGMSIITSVVAENTMGVIKISDVDSDTIEKQFQAVFEDIFPDSVKIGMLSQKSAIKAVYEGLAEYKPKNVVMDTVMYAKDGTPLMDSDCMDFVISKIIPMADVITPNIPEAEVISGIAIKTVEDMKNAAKGIYNLSGTAVLVKGGHSQDECTDILFDGRDFYTYTSPKINTKNTHGTGCTLSSAIAADIAKGKTVEKAVGEAKEYITLAIKHSLNLGRGNGPLNHTYAIYGG